MSALAFVSWFEATFPDAPKGEYQHAEMGTDFDGEAERRPRVVTLDSERLGVATIAIPYAEFPDTVTLHHLEAKPSGHGKGGRILDHLCAKADELGVYIQLLARPKDGSGMPTEKLIGFYQDHGFEPGTNRFHANVYRTVMLRHPRARGAQ